MQHHDVEKVFGATAAVHRQGAAQPFTLRRYSWHVTAAIAVLCTWLAWASGGRWQRLAGSEIGLQTSQRARAEPPDNATFAICTIINLVADDPQWIDGRAEDLHEWVDYHKTLGVGRIYLFDHLSPPAPWTRLLRQVPLNTTLRADIASGYVHYEYFTVPKGGEKNPMLEVYNTCLTRFGTQHRHIAMIDSDEYFVLMDKRPGAPTTLGQLMGNLYDIRPFGALGVPWVLFGSSGHRTRPKGGTLKNYWRCLPRHSSQSRHIKTIINTQHSMWATTVHTFQSKDPYYTITEKFERFDGVIMPENTNTVDKIALFHYVVKSWADFKYKWARGGGDGNVKTEEYFTLTESEAICNCTEFAMIGAANECSDGTHPYRTAEA